MGDEIYRKITAMSIAYHVKKEQKSESMTDLAGIFIQMSKKSIREKKSNSVQPLKRMIRFLSIHLRLSPEGSILSLR